MAKIINTPTFYDLVQQEDSSFVYLRRPNNRALMGISSFLSESSLKHCAWQCLGNYEFPWNSYFSNLFPKFLIIRSLDPGLKENLFLMTVDSHIVVARFNDEGFIYHCKVMRLWDKRTLFHKSVNTWQHFSNSLFRHNNMSNRSSCKKWSELKHIQICKTGGWNLDIQSLKIWLHHKW